MSKRRRRRRRQTEKEKTESKRQTLEQMLKALDAKRERQGQK